MQSTKSASIPSQNKKSFREQFQASSIPGTTYAYVAMFGEIDEWTAVLKCTNQVLIGKSSFETFEGLPSGHHLKICSDGRRMIREGMDFRIR